MPEQVPAPPNSNLKDLPRRISESMGHSPKERIFKLSILVALGAGMVGVAMMPDAPSPPAHVGSAHHQPEAPTLNHE